jgi:hypothetical protein
MRVNNAAFLFLLSIAACNSNKQVPDPAPTGQNSNPANECGNAPCEHVAFMKKGDFSSADQNATRIKLSSPEHASLTAALATASTTGPGEASHIHVAAANGQLVFSSDNVSDPGTISHLSAKDPEISLTEGEGLKTMVTTAPANELLRKRAVP